MKHFLVILTMLIAAGAASAQGPAARDYAADASALVSQADVERDVRAFAGMGSRVLGYPGNLKAAETVAARLRELGYEKVTVEDFDRKHPVPVPMDRGATLEVPGLLDRPIAIYPLWPNLVRTSQLPRLGVSGHLVYVGRGDYADMNGKKIEGSIALMDFNCGRNFVNVKDMGAQAIVFIEPKETWTVEAESKMLEVPVSIPRFWMKRSDAEALVGRALATRPGVDLPGRTLDEMLPDFKRTVTGMDPYSTVAARAFCRMPWERADGKNVYTVIYGSDPVLRNDLIVVQAYYDSISVVPGLAPGASTTGGIVGLLELAKALKAHPPKRSVLLLATGSHFVSWEGISDWMLRHGPRGGTEVNQDSKGARVVSWFTWVIRIFFLSLTAAFVAIIVTSSTRITHWRKLARSDPEAARKAEGQGSLRFVASILLVPAAIIALLSNLEPTYEFSTPEPLKLDAPAQMKFFFSLDLSSSSKKVGIFFNDSALYDAMWDATSHRAYMAQYARRLMDFSRSQKLRETLGVDVVNAVEPAGRTGSDFVPMPGYLLDGTVILRTGNPALTFFTVEDLRRRLDTPLDSPDAVDFANLTAQIRAVNSLVLAAVDSPDFLQQTSSQVIRDRVKQLTTRVVEANYRESFVADTPVVDALVVYKPNGTEWTPSAQMNCGAVRGIRIGITDSTGIAVNRFIQAAGATNISGQNVEVRAYRMSADDGRITYAPDRGEQGEKSYPLLFAISHPLTGHQVVAFQCEPLDLYQVVNPRYLRAVGSGGWTPPVIFDVDDAAPQEYGYDFFRGQDINTGKTEDTAVVYVKRSPPGTRPNRVKIIMGSTVFGVEYLLTNTQEGVEKGIPEPHPGVGFTAVPMGTVPDSALSFARDMFRIDDWRMRNFERYGVVKPFNEASGPDNEWLPVIHHRARKHLDAAEKDLAAARYDGFRTNLDKALGYEARAYPDVKGTANDIVRGFLFYCILLLPFAYFCERLFLGFADIRKQLFAFAGFFLLIFGLMAIVHPVFRITGAPYVILLAFVILALAVSVLAIIVAKFNEQMAQMRRKAAKVHEADVGRLSATGTAVLLGISNMKKRKVRTTLTTLTLVLLTFTVMSFTSVKTSTVYNEIPQSHKASYTGLLLRDRGWFALETPALEQFSRQFGSKGKVVPRAWLSSLDATNAVNFNFLIYGPGGSQVDCLGLVGMMPEESGALNLGSWLVAGRWFRSPDEMSVVLPSHVAFDLLGIRREDVDNGTARVRLRGLDLQVVGVLDSARIDQVHDLDDESFTPLDMSTKSTFGAKLAGGMFTENLVEIVKLPHLATDSAAVVPFDVCRRLGGRVASAAVVFDPGVDFEPDLKELLERVGMTVFMGRDGQVKAYSSIALSSVGDVGNLFIPILIAALIVLNTMMGSVHERAREIGIYSSVGLAPVHIGFLFLAESCVYAVMGAISGYLLGTIAGKGVSLLDIPGLTLNYSSLSAVFSTVVVMGTVLLSTIYPAMMAARMAVPDVTRQWKFPEPKGDVWKFDFPFTVGSKGVVGLFVFLDNYFDSYREESIGSFYADHIQFRRVKDTYGTGYVVELDCWLAPFDLAVSQNVQLRALPTEDEGIARIEMCITRLSGEPGNWTRLNRGFLTLLRKQFLIWRTVAPEVKEQYGREGREKLGLET